MTTSVTPKVYLIARPTVLLETVNWLEDLGASTYAEGIEDRLLGYNAADSELLAELAGRRCYRSFEPGLNPNVTKIRTDTQEYLDNIISSGHGSVLEHAQWTFAFENVSRVFTHELVRHRVGVAISQESLRYVRLDNIPFWTPEWAQEDEELSQRSAELLAVLEAHQLWMAEHFKLDDPGVPFSEKKHKTSFMRRFAPEGLATGLLWSANIRTLRHVLERRTDVHAEEEIRLVFNQVGEIMRKECEGLFSDYVTENGQWITPNGKV